MPAVSFDHAFDRWYRLTATEKSRIEADKCQGTPIFSWEALDHLCGIAVESGIKALMIKAKLVQPDHRGDYPADAQGRRPHVDALWTTFMAKSSNRTAEKWIRKLAGGSGTPASVFAEWRTEHRYAPDGTVSENVVAARLQMASRLKAIAQEEGL